MTKKLLQTARYPAQCVVCQNWIPKGSVQRWDFVRKAAVHPGCWTPLLSKGQTAEHEALIPPLAVRRARRAKTLAT